MSACSIEKCPLCGWKYAITIKELNLLNTKTDIEYMYYCMKKCSLINNTNSANIKGLLNEFGNTVKKRLKLDIPNLSNDEIEAIKTLINDKSLIISKADKGNAVVVLNREDYLQKGQSILDDKRAFKQLNENPTDEREKKFIDFLLKLKKKKVITDDEYKRMRLDAGSRTPEAYFLVKVHKSNQPVRPIILSYDAYNYKTAKFLANLLSPVMKEGSSYIKDSFDFIRMNFINKDSTGLMFSLDVSSLFTNVSLEKSVDIAMRKIRQYHLDWKISDNNLRELFYICTKKN
ncbi:unnamed protein product [Didymodactylos carnosus]|uniref:Reverse transcriptase domain-containing protein n=1 Tax=Didymodactylos carnosus TaxID=1234261 RepID=A0A814QQD8_9BILA|nr:unnamed protein product [Didymodactylos carnosus]CAF3887198.1 unnamed protein product [Didymodactylos carnosus]